MLTSTKGTALVTGASSGIGAVYADRLAKRGYDLILVARNERRLEDIAGRITASTGRAIEVMAADLTAPKDLQRVMQRMTNDGRITVLVNNAGIAAGSSLDTADTKVTGALIALNVAAFTELAYAAARKFKQRRGGTLINIASVAALRPRVTGAVYAASKAYELAFTQALAIELANTGVRLQAVLPGATRTAIWERAGVDIASLPANSVMEAGEMVDAALAGLDQGELVTIPSLPDASDWARFEEARAALAPNLSRDHAADRFGVSHATAA